MTESQTAPILSPIPNSRLRPVLLRCPLLLLSRQDLSRIHASSSSLFLLRRPRCQPLAGRLVSRGLQLKARPPSRSFGARARLHAFGALIGTGSSGQRRRRKPRMCRGCAPGPGAPRRPVRQRALLAADTYAAGQDELERPKPCASPRSDACLRAWRVEVTCDAPLGLGLGILQVVSVALQVLSSFGHRV